jgi:hypothetical protein
VADPAIEAQSCSMFERGGRGIRQGNIGFAWARISNESKPGAQQTEQRIGG